MSDSEDTRAQRPLSGQPAHVDALDGLRALAIYLVVNMHLGVYSRHLPAYNVVTAAGWMGVPLFFVLSGMLLTLPYVKAGVSEGSCPSTARFYKRRALRIFPLFYISLTVFILLDLWSGVALPSRAEIVRHILFLHNYQANFSSLNAPYWSLAVEIQFYVALPVIGIIIYRLLRARRFVVAVWLVVGIAALSLLYRVAVTSNHGLLQRLGYKSLIYMSTISNFDSFATGMLCALVYARFLNSPSIPSSWQKVAWPLLALSVTGLFGLMYFDGMSNYKEGGATWFAPGAFYSLLNVCWAGCIIGALSRPHSWLAQILNHRSVRFVSTISYSIYIWHPLCGRAAHYLWSRQHFGSTQLAALVILLTDVGLILIVSTATYYGIERPFLRLPVE